MATTHGKVGLVKVGTATVAEVVSWDLDEQANLTEDHQLTDTYATFLVGRKSWTATVTCRWDDTDSTGQEALRAGSSVALHLLPEGATTGDEDYTGTAIVASVSESLPEDGAIMRTISLVGNGALDRDTPA